MMSSLKDLLATVFRPEERRASPLLHVCQSSRVLRLIVNHLDLETILQLELVCRHLRQRLVEERVYRDLVSAGIRSGQFVGGGWGWRRQRHSLLSSPTQEESSVYFKRRLVAYHNLGTGTGTGQDHPVHNAVI